MRTYTPNAFDLMVSAVYPAARIFLLLAVEARAAFSLYYLRKLIRTADYFRVTYSRLSRGRLYSEASRRGGVAIERRRARWEQFILMVIFVMGLWTGRISISE